MTSLDTARPPRPALAAVVAAVAFFALGLVSSAAADSHASKPKADVGPRVLPALELVSQGGRKPRPAGAVSNASLVLDKGVFRALPDVPGALVTTHSRNNNRGESVGLYVDDSGLLGRGFLMSRSGRITKIDVPGAVVTNPLGVNDRGQVVGSWVGPDAKPDPIFGQLKPANGFVWQSGRFRTFDVPGSTTTAGYEINNRGWIVGNYEDADRVLHGYLLRDGKFTAIDHPRASRQPDTTGTRVVGIDDRGRLVGSYGDQDGLIHAWRWEKGAASQTWSRRVAYRPRPAKSTTAGRSWGATSMPGRSWSASCSRRAATRGSRRLAAATPPPARLTTAARSGSPPPAPPPAPPASARHPDTHNTLRDPGTPEIGRRS